MAAKVVSFPLDLAPRVPEQIVLEIDPVLVKTPPPREMERITETEWRFINVGVAHPVIPITLLSTDHAKVDYSALDPVAA